MTLPQGDGQKSVHETRYIPADSVENGSRDVKEANNGAACNQKKKKMKQKLIEQLEEPVLHGDGQWLSTSGGPHGERDKTSDPTIGMSEQAGDGEQNKTGVLQTSDRTAAVGRSATRPPVNAYDQ